MVLFRDFFVLLHVLSGLQEVVENILVVIQSF